MAYLDSDNVDELVADIKDLADQTYIPRARKFVVISDSYGLGTTYGETTTGWIENFRGILGLTQNTNLFSSAVGGSGFVGNSGVANFNSQLNTLYSSISAPNEITDVIFAGGYNDISATGSDLDDAIRLTVSNTKSKFPNAKIWVLQIAYATGAHLADRNLLISTKLIYDHISSVVGCVFCDVSKVLKSHSRWMSADNIHPTTVGYSYLAENISKFIQGGQVISNYIQQSVTMVPATDITITKTDIIQMHAVNDQINIFQEQIVLDNFKFPAGTLTNAATSWVTLATLENSLVHGTSNRNYIPVTGFIFRSSYDEFQGFVSIYNDQFQVMIRNIRNGAYDNLSQVTRLTIDLFSAHMPIDFV